MPAILRVYINTEASASSLIGYRTLMYSLRKVYQISKQPGTWGSDLQMSQISSTMGLGMWHRSMAHVRSIDGLAALHTRSTRSNLGETPCTIQSPRRLFPENRTPWATSNVPKTASLCRYLPDETLQRIECGIDNYEQDWDDDGRSTSSGTVKMGAWSNPDLPDPNTWLPLEDCYPIEQPRTPHLLLHLDEKMGDVSHRMNPKTSETTPTGLDDAFTTPSYYTKQTAQRKVRISSKPKICGPEPVLGFKATQSLPNLREALKLEFGDPTPLEGAICRISSWDASVQLYTNATMSKKGEVKIQYHAHLSVTIPKQEIDTARICLNLIVTHGLRGNHTRHLEAGHSSLYLDDEPSATPSTEPAKAEIEIIRNVCDMERPLDLYFASSYPTSDHIKNMQVLPSFRPSNGRVLSESVFLREPDAPLTMKTKARSLYSTWKATPGSLNKVTQFERIDTPPLYPLGLRDDLRVGIMENAAVEFQSLNALASTDVVWNFDIEIQQLLGMALECRMSLYVEVQRASNRLVTIDSHGWIPTFFLVDGSLATEQVGEWRQLDGQLTLFKQAHMVPGPIKLELNWQGPPTMAYSECKSPYKLLLPSVLDHEVLGGSLRCKTIGTVFLTNPGARDDFELESDTKLPTMHKEYRLYLNRKPTAQNAPVQLPRLSPIPEHVEANNYSTSADSHVTANTGSDQSIITSAEDQGAISQPSLGLIPDLEANDDPDGRENLHQDRTESRATDSVGWFRTLLLLFVAAMVVWLIWPLRMLFPPELRDGDRIGHLPNPRLSHEVETLAYAPLENLRLSHGVEDLGPRGVEDLGLETLTDSMIAGTESYGTEEGEVAGWRWWRDVFDYTFGWPGPISE